MIELHWQRPMHRRAGYQLKLFFGFAEEIISQINLFQNIPIFYRNMQYIYFQLLYWKTQHSVRLYWNINCTQSALDTWYCTIKVAQKHSIANYVETGHSSGPGPWWDDVAEVGQWPWTCWCSGSLSFSHRHCPTPSGEEMFKISSWK